MSKARRRRRYNKGKWEVERERCRLEAKAPPDGIEDALPVGQSIALVMKRLGLGQSHWLVELQEKWEVIVGKDVAEHSRPGRMEGKDLVVFVDSSVWLSELSRYWSAKMLTNIQKEFGKKHVAAIRFLIDPSDKCN